MRKQLQVKRIQARTCRHTQTHTQTHTRTHARTDTHAHMQVQVAKENVQISKNTCFKVSEIIAVCWCFEAALVRASV
jgi:hypothetical protein